MQRTKPISLLFAMTILMICGLAWTAQASANTSTGTTIMVESTVDSLSDNGICSLREAIFAANSDAPFGDCPAGNGVDTIVLQSNSFYLVNLEGTNEDLNSTGDFDIRDDLNIVASGAQPAVIGAQNRYRILDIHAGATVTLTQIGLVAGASTTHGGALRVLSGSASLTGAFVNLSEAGLLGGGIYVAPDQALQVNDVTFEQNEAGQAGGAIAMSGLNGTLSIADSLFRGNQAVEYGGAISIGGQSDTTLEDLVIENNSAEIGGGIAYYQSENNLLTNSTVRNNTASANGGGIAMIHFKGSPIGAASYISNTHLLSNTAATSGGGIYVENAAVTIGSQFGTCVLNDAYCATIQGNRANNPERDGGGGIYVISGTTTVENVAITDNTVESGTSIDHGSAIWAGNSTVNVTNALVTENGSNSTTSAVHLVYATTFASQHVTYADNGSAFGTVFGDSIGNQISLTNDIVWGNVEAGFLGFGVASFDCNTVQASPSPWNDAENSADNPLFVDAANDDYHLQATSPAIDQCGSGSADDLEGNSRPAGSSYDRGAFEHQSTPPTAVQLHDAAASSPSRWLLVALFASITIASLICVRYAINMD